MISCLVRDGGCCVYLCYVCEVPWYDRYGSHANDGNRELFIHSFGLVGLLMYKLQAYRTRTLESEFCLGGHIPIDNLP